MMSFINGAVWATGVVCLTAFSLWLSLGIGLWICEVLGVQVIRMGL